MGKLLIDEKRIEGSVRPLRTQEDVHMRTMELIRSTSKEPAESRPQRHPVATHTTNKVLQGAPLSQWLFQIVANHRFQFYCN